MRGFVWQKAAAYAAREHDHEKRDDDETPYFAHPARVALTVAHLFCCNDETALTAALLHDVVENTGESYDDVRSEFGAEVAEIVVALTKNTMLPDAERDADYERRLKAADWRARLVKIADVYDNYVDAGLGLKKNRRKIAAKCRRIIRLAAPDAKFHPETRRALRLLKKLIGEPMRPRARRNK